MAHIESTTVVTGVTVTPPVISVDYGHAVTSTTSASGSISGFIRGYTSPTGRDSVATPLPGSVVEFLKVTAASPSTNRTIQRDGCSRTNTLVGSTTTDATGSFQISGLAEGLHDLRVTPPGVSRR